MVALPSAVSDGQADGVRALRRSDECSICGDPIVGTCNAKYPEWIVVLPGELQKQDVFQATDERLYAVDTIQVHEAEELVTVKTAQRKDWRIFHLLLPLLVKRRSARERGKAELTKDYREERQRKNAIRKRYQPFEQTP